ncbi:MAG: hypothetical protein PHW36_00615, partial [Bacilli bacterium]|nr:hypothetical protein [Bacilli bacterium]
KNSKAVNYYHFAKALKDRMIAPMSKIDVPRFDQGLFIWAACKAGICFLRRIFNPSANRANLAIKALAKSEFSTA